MEYYVEIRELETEENSFKPLEIVRKYVKDVKEAEEFYAVEILKFKDKAVDAGFVEMNHHPEPKLNKPCKNKSFVDGKVIL